MDETSPTTFQTAPSIPSPPPDLSDRAHRSALLIVFLVTFIDLLGWGLVLPLLPRFAKEFIPGGDASPYKGITIGALMAAFSAMQFIFAPIWGRVSDSIGRRPVLLIGLFCAALFNGLMGFAALMGTEGQRELGLILLFVARLGGGVACATVGTAQAVIADSTAPEKRSRGMALIGAAFGIGFTFGPLLGFGALLVIPNAGGPGFLAAGLSLIAFILAIALLPETLRKGVAPIRHRTWFDFDGLRTALDTPGVGLLMLIFFVSTFAFAIFEPTLALLTETAGLGLDAKHNFLIFTYVGLVLGVAQGLIYRRLAARVSEQTFIRLGTLLMACGLAGMGLVAHFAEQAEPWPASILITQLLVMLAVAVTGFAFVTPSVQSLISRFSDPTRQGEILGVNQSANAMARILGPAAGVPLYYLTPDHVVPYCLSAGLLLAVLLLSAGVRQG